MAGTEVKHNNIINFLTSSTGCNSSFVKNVDTSTNPLSKNCSSCHCSSCPGFLSNGCGGITVYTSGAAATAEYGKDIQDQMTQGELRRIQLSLY